MFCLSQKYSTVFTNVHFTNVPQTCCMISMHYTLTYIQKQIRYQQVIRDNNFKSLVYCKYFGYDEMIILLLITGQTSIKFNLHMASTPNLTSVRPSLEPDCFCDDKNSTQHLPTGTVLATKNITKLWIMSNTATTDSSEQSLEIRQFWISSLEGLMMTLRSRNMQSRSGRV